MANKTKTIRKRLKANNGQQLKIRIAGSGSANEIAKALRVLASEIAKGDHLESILAKGECEWEDPILFIELTLAE